MFDVVVAKSKKLVTSEDPYHVHKLCGVACLCNFAYQISRFLLGCSVRPENPWTLAPHGLLHVSSFIFRVLPHRQIGSRANMYIWEELRSHATLFGLRACLVILFPAFGFWISLGTMVLADVATTVQGRPGLSTVRGAQERVGNRSWKKELAAAFFSTSQLGATLITSGLFQQEEIVRMHNNDPSGGGGGYAMLVFATLPPIQTSAFGMTLIRKNLIDQKTWSAVYVIELLFVYYVWYMVYANMNVLGIASVMYILRRAGVSKYTIWIACYILDRRFS